MHWHQGHALLTPASDTKGDIFLVHKMMQSARLLAQVFSPRRSELLHRGARNGNLLSALPPTPRSPASWYSANIRRTKEAEKGPHRTPSDFIDPASSSIAASMQWRRAQIEKVERKFSEAENDCVDEGEDSADRSEPLSIESDEDLQDVWRNMESRVTKRRSLTAAERGGIVGRRNIRKSDEDVWLESGVYDGGEVNK